MPHFGHAGVLIVVRAISSRSDIGRRDTYSRVPTVVADVEADAHTVRDIDPEDPSSMSSLLAFDWTHAVPQSF